MLKGSVLWAAMFSLLSFVASNSQFELRPTNSLQYILKSLGGFADPSLKPVEIYTEVIEDSSADNELARYLQLSLTTSAKIISELILTRPTTEQLRLGENNKCTDIESSQVFKSGKLIADIAIIAVRNKNKGAITSQRCEIGNNKSLLSGVLRINEKEFEALDEFSQVKELCFAIARVLFEDREKEKIMIQEEINKYLSKAENWKVSILRACTIGDSNCLECDGSNKNCVACGDGYVINGGVCVACTAPCATCKNTANYCLTCNDVDHTSVSNGVCICTDQNASFNTQNTACQCNSGYFGSPNNCIECDTNCAACIGTAGNCLTCSDTTHMSAAPICACPTDRALQGNTCVSSPGYFFRSHTVSNACNANCATCSVSAGNCLTCSDTTHMSAAPDCACPANGSLQGNTCVCNAGYFFYSNTVCIPCYSKCATCTWAAENCLTCSDTTHMSAAPDCACPANGVQQGANCICNAGYYFTSDTVCTACNTNCATCSGTAGNCLTCSDQIHMSAAPFCVCPINSVQQGANCVCNAGLYFGPNSVCSMCDAQCATCSRYPNNCLTCSDAARTAVPTCYCPANSVLQGKTCVCNAGYFFSPNNVCVPCYHKCATCNGINGDCLTCYDVVNMSAAPACACPINSSLGRNHLCQCNDGYFFSSKAVCSACNANCGSCFRTAENCSYCSDQSRMSLPPACACPINASLKGHGCLCNDGYFFSSNATCIACNTNCAACSQNCATCSGTAENCLTCADTTHMSAVPACSCPTNSVLTAGSCVCSSGYHYNSNTVCTACQAPCAECSGSPPFCTTCDDSANMVINAGICACKDPNANFNTGTLTCVCKKGYWNNAGTCSECQPPCTACSLSATDCTECPDGDYKNGDTCSPCQAPCATCVTSATNCLSCNDATHTTLSDGGVCSCTDPNASFNAQNTICQCNSGYFESLNSCTACNTNCITCNTTAGNCVTCKDPTRMSAAPACNCPANSVQVGPSCVCSAGYYFSSNTVCSTCAPQCAACSVAVNACTQCRDPTHMTAAPVCACPANGSLQGTTCVCNAGYFSSSNTVCSACALQCVSCSNTNANCESCIDTLHMSAAPACACPTNGSLLGNTCACNIGYYFSSNTVCSACQPNCASCDLYLNICSTCKDTTHMSAAPSCSCPANSTLVGNTCACDQGYYYSSNTVCSACHTNCQTCSSYDFCTACNDTANMYFNPATGTCKCWDPYASFNQSSGTCQCIQGYYLASSGLCQICMTPCSQCSSVANFCTQCDDSANMNLNIATGTCTCKDPNNQFNPWVKICQNNPGCNCTSYETI